MRRSVSEKLADDRRRIEGVADDILEGLQADEISIELVEDDSTEITLRYNDMWPENAARTLRHTAVHYPEALLGVIESVEETADYETEE